jgi:multiple sugar transport system permease protein/cellobiose transport system permease protein
MVGRSFIVRLIMVLFVGVVSIVAIYPYYSMIMMGTYYSNDLFTGIKILPGDYLKENLATLKTINILTFYKNSVLVAVSCSILTVLVCAAAGFGFAKYQFRFKKPLFTFILLTMMVPLQLGIVAFVVEMRTIGWLKTLLPLIVPPAANAFGAFWMTQFALQAIPDEVMESARIDGCSEFRIFTQIALPFMVPACTTLGLLSFLLSWNSLFAPLIVISDAKLFTIPLGIRQLATNFRMDNAAQILGLTLTSIPILFLFALFSRSLISGLSSAAVKG